MQLWFSSVLILATVHVVLAVDDQDVLLQTGVSVVDNKDLLDALEERATAVAKKMVSSSGALDGAVSNKDTWTPKEPSLPGILPGSSKPKVILAQDIDWPPYAYLGEPPESDYQVAGIGYDIIMGMGALCNFDVTVVQTDWADCWAGGKIGAGLKDGHYHGCMTYTHTQGERNRFAEFSQAILKDNKPAGLIVRLDAQGNPLVGGSSDLSGLNVVDVNGWAPTSDTLGIVNNPCTGQKFSGYNLIIPAETGNDAAMAILRSGQADAMWVYADQAYNYDCTAAGVTPSWNCTLWGGFGTDYAYIQTGLFDHAFNGTTLTMAKKGSGIAQIINPCLQRYMKTADYYNVCSKHSLVDSCFPNSYFPNANSAPNPWEILADQLTTTCADGYCPCSAAPSPSR